MTDKGKDITTHHLHGNLSPRERFENTRLKCNKCSSQNPGTFIFCSKCGSRIARLCPYCKDTHGLNATLCPRTGEPIGAGATPTERSKNIKTTLVAGAAALALLASGCASTLKENRKDIAGIGWGCNPILPIPAMGCYVGTNNEATNPESERYIIESFKEKYGIQPAFNNILPKFRCGSTESRR